MPHLVGQDDYLDDVYRDHQSGAFTEQMDAAAVIHVNHTSCTVRCEITLFFMVRRRQPSR